MTPETFKKAYTNTYWVQFSDRGAGCITVAADEDPVTASPDADGKTLLSARAPAGAPPLPPGTVTFALASGGGTAAGDVHLGLAQATLVLPCGGSAVVDAAYVPAAAAGGEGRTGKTTAFSKEC